MIRFMLKFGGVSTLLFAVCIALIRAQPYDDSELRAFLTPPEGCPAPCFMGIRPGVTTMEEAVVILEAHEWVGEIRVNEVAVLWKWHSDYHQFLRRDEPFFHAALEIDNGIVVSVYIPNSIQFGNIWLSLGEPERALISPVMVGGTGQGVRYYVAQTTEYDVIDFAVLTETSCPINPSKIWNSAASFELRSNEPQRPSYRYSYTETLKFPPFC